MEKIGYTDVTTSFDYFVKNCEVMGLTAPRIFYK